MDIRPYACTECDLKFKVRNHLKKHFTRKHPEFEPELNPGNLKKDKDSTVKQEYNDDAYYENGRVCERMSLKSSKILFTFANIPHRSFWGGLVHPSMFIHF